MERKPSLIPTALDAVLIGVSEFFRDEAVYEELRQQVIPALLEHRRGLRVLSAGCSEGQELYSVAMILEELGALKPSSLLGVDCRPEAIARARAGIFPLADVHRVPAGWQQKYFQSHGSRVAARGFLTSATLWEVGDLFSRSRNSALDLVLFRNVAIYLEPERAAGLWQNLISRLTAGGVLVVGKAEQPPRSLPLHKLSHCIYRKLSR